MDSKSAWMPSLIANQCVPSVSRFIEEADMVEAFERYVEKEKDDS